MRVVRRLAALVAAGVAITACGGGSRNDRATEPVPMLASPAPGAASSSLPAAPVSMPAGPTIVDDVGRPGGFTPDPAGARAAAITYVGLTGEVMTAGFISRDDLIGEMATDRYAPELAASTAQEVRTIEDRLDASGAAGQLLVDEHPLRARVAENAGGRVTVEVWSVAVIGVVDAATAQQVWRTTRAVLVWEDNDWRLDEWSSTPGPAPAFVGESGVSPLVDMQVPLGWPAAVGAIDEAGS